MRVETLFSHASVNTILLPSYNRWGLVSEKGGQSIQLVRVLVRQLQK